MLRRSLVYRGAAAFVLGSFVVCCIPPSKKTAAADPQPVPGDLTSRDMHKRRAAIFSSHKWPQADIDRKLASIAARDPVPGVRYDAAEALGRRESTALLQYYGNDFPDDSTSLFYLAFSLRGSGSADAVRALKRLARSKWGRVRIEAYRSLSRVGSPEALNFLESLPTESMDKTEYKQLKAYIKLLRRRIEESGGQP